MPDDTRVKPWFDAVASEEYENVRRLCGYLVYSAGLDASFAEDLVQQVFFTAWVKREELQSHPKPRAWLYKAVRYSFGNLVRKQLYLQRMQAMSLDEPSAENRAQEGEDALEALLREEPSEAMRPILKKLSARDQLLYHHLYLLKRDLPALCGDYGITAQALKKRIYRLHRRLVAALEEGKFQTVSK